MFLLDKEYFHYAILYCKIVPSAYIVTRMPTQTVWQCLFLRKYCLRMIEVRRPQPGGQLGNCPHLPKFSKTCLVVRYSIKSRSIIISKSDGYGHEADTG